MPDALNLVRQLASTQDWVIDLRQAIGVGMTRDEIRREVRGGRWTALLRGVYLMDPDVYAGVLPIRVWWRAALLAHGPDAHLVAGSGARALNVQGLPMAEDVVEIGLGHHMPRASRGGQAVGAEGPKVVVRQLPPSHDVVVVDGFLVRHPRATVIDAAIDLDRRRALAVMDSALHQGLITPDELTASLDAAKGRPGVQQLRSVAGHVDGRAESAVESQLRLCCIDEGVEPDELQLPVHDASGHLIAIGDLGWHRNRRRPLLAEADGVSVHDTVTAVFRDRARGNDLTGQSCDTLRFTYADTFRPSYVGYVVRRALAAG